MASPGCLFFTYSKTLTSEDSKTFFIKAARYNYVIHNFAAVVVNFTRHLLCKRYKVAVKLLKGSFFLLVQ